MNVAFCDHRKCRRRATQAFDVRPAWGAKRDEDMRHYEVCDKHADAFFRPATEYDWIDVSRAERIKSELIPS